MNNAMIPGAMLAAGAVAASAWAQPDIARLELWSTVTQNPMQVTAIPGEHAMVFGVERSGRIRAVDTQTGLDYLNGTNNGIVLDLRLKTLVQGDGGVLAVAFPANFAISRDMYVYYNRRPDFAGVLARYHVPAGSLTADPNSEEILLVMPRPNGHNGGWIGFSPVDGFLYVALGDAGTSANPDPLNRSQTITGREFAGKVLRLDVSGIDDFPGEADRNYAIPPGNPFVGRVGDDEIWSYGLRNPWRCDFDSVTGDLWIGDVGQDLWEEVHWEPSGSPGGRNYGWRCMEHTACTGLSGCVCGDASLTPALYAYGHDVGCSISAGVVYRGSAIPGLVGAFLYTDWCTGRLWGVTQAGGQVSSVTEWTDVFLPAGAVRPDNPSAVCKDAAGEVYVLDHQTSRIFKLRPVCQADFNRDDFVDFFDYLEYVQCFEGQGCPSGRTADFNGDAFVDFFDYSEFVAAFQAGC